MDWSGAREDEKRVLKRIVALLFAFASLAESLSDRPRPVRALVLWILRFAETVARDFVIDTALDQGAPLTPAVLLIPALHGGDNPADAMRLAVTFRALAILLDRLAHGNPGRGGMRLTGMCIALAACATSCGLSAGPMFGRRQLCLAGPGFAVERRDSS